MTQVLLTGGSGSIAVHTLQSLLERGWDEMIASLRIPLMTHTLPVIRYLRRLEIRTS